MTNEIAIKDAYCLAPWVNFHINQKQQIKPCCNWYQGYESVENYVAGNEPSIIELKQQLISNKPSSFCSKCSEKNWYSEFKQADISLKAVDDFLIKSLDIRWTSTCQLTCMYCHENFSSSWAAAKNKHQTIPIVNPRIKNVEMIFEFLKKNQIKRISLLGGEPLLMKENIQLLEIIDSDIAIEIFTNLNVELLGNKVFDLLIRRSNVQWYISMENIGSKFEFVRRGADWSQQTKNLQILQSYKPKSVTLQSQYCVYSAFDLVDLYQFAEDNNCTVNLVGNNFKPVMLDIFSFPQPFKQQALDELDRCLELFPECEYKLDPVRQKLLNDWNVVMPNIVDLCVAWHNDLESKFFNHQFKFVDLWPQFEHLAC